MSETLPANAAVVAAVCDSIVVAVTASQQQVVSVAVAVVVAVVVATVFVTKKSKVQHCTNCREAC